MWRTGAGQPLPHGKPARRPPDSISGVTGSTAGDLIEEGASSGKTSVRAMARRTDPQQRAVLTLHDLPLVRAANGSTPG